MAEFSSRLRLCLCARVEAVEVIAACFAISAAVTMMVGDAKHLMARPRWPFYP